MPDGSSQSQITMRLNDLADRSRRDGAVRTNALAKLALIGTPAANIALEPLIPNQKDTLIAVTDREQTHIRNWPPDQLDALRTALLTAVSLRRLIVFDWAFVDEPANITIRTGPLGVFVTFRSRAEVQTQ